ncbi:sphingolipid homeostasis protein orm1 [Coemansia asiatica]|nr:sphingolipid homeostasis protein orm1 [Coemansia asiatica]
MALDTVVQRVASAANLNELSVNPNSHWVNLKALRLIFSLIPWSTPELSWTLTNLSYCLFQYIMFHGIIGTPFEVNQGAYDNLTLWEQMDNGEQYTPTKKFLTVVPIAV